MLFQHYTAEDALNVDKALHGRFTIENLETVIQAINPYLQLKVQETPDDYWYSVTTNEPGKVAFLGITFSSSVFDKPMASGFSQAFISPKSFIHHDGLPIIGDIIQLREDHPELSELTDQQALRTLYSKQTGE